MAICQPRTAVLVNNFYTLHRCKPLHAAGHRASMTENEQRTAMAALLDYLYPPRCLLCHAPGARLCRDCADGMPRLAAARCVQCAHPLAGSAAGRCGRCQRHPPAFDYTAAAFAYGAPLDIAVQQWKYAGRLAWAAPLAEGWLSAWDEPPARPEALIPVPLHWRRLLRRGFNQAGLLAQHWGRACRIPVLHHQARRRRHTPQQAQLAVTERRQNVSGAFAVKPLRVRHVAIVDDVMTTGSTAHALAAALRQAGAERVDLWVLARAVDR
ncbi:MAG: double zinc ribbon domain-containing protein [Pseudomonadota bacterium]